MKAKKSGCGPKALIIVGVIVVVIAILGVVIGSHGSSSNTGTLSSSNNNTGNSTISAPAPTTASNQHFKVGDTVTVGNSWKVVVNSITADDGGQYSALKSGDTYVIVDVSLTNLTSSEQTASSLLMFTLKDSTGQKYDESIDTNVNGSTPDGKVAAGDTLRGIIAYEVPASQKSFTLAFAPDLTSSGQTIWDLSLS